MTLEARKIRLVMELRQAGISDTAVLSAIERVPREAFVPEPFQDRAYENCALPIGQGQTLSQPQVVATGGLADLWHRGIDAIDHVDIHLTLKGLRLFWERCGKPA